MTLLSYLGRSGFLPHGYCFAWNPTLLWTMVGADVLTAMGYFAISGSIVALMHRRPEPALHRVATLFSAFIFTCGCTHLLDVWTIWKPDYAALALTKAATAALSFATAIAAWRLLPVAAVVPSVDVLQRTVRALEQAMTERQAAERASVDVEQNLAATLASIDAGLIVTDAAGNVTRMNEVAERITGWPVAHALGRSYWEVFVRDGRTSADLQGTIVDVITEQRLGVETAHRVCAVSRHGVRTQVEVKAELKRGDDGSIHGMLAILQDRTGIDRAEEDRRRLAAIVESSSDAIVGKSVDGRITSWNRAAAELFGYTAEEVLGKSVQLLIPPERRAEEMDILANLFDGQWVPPFETVRITKDGRRLDLSLTISPIRDVSGRIVGGSKIARDIGPQLRMVAALRESKARLGFALEVAGIGDWDLDLRTGAMHRSIRHDHCFGYRELQPTWSVAILLAHVHPDDRDPVAAEFEHAARHGVDWRSEFRVFWPDGSQHWLLIHGSTRYDTGDTDRMLGIVTDVSDRRAAEHARLRAQRLENDNRQIQESNRLKSQFLANMSHELRSPLNAIIGFSDLLCTASLPVPAAQQQVFIGHIRTSGRHLLQLINDVLDLSKVESGKFEFFPEAVHLPALAQEVRGVLFSLLQRRALSLDIHIDPTVADVVTDPSRLKQMLFNYLSNAIKFSAEGGRIALRAYEVADGCFRIDVKDDGVGIARDDLPRLFVEFQQLDAGYTKRHQGTGLGLALTRRLAEAQGGSVGVDSLPGQGSTFHLVLPMDAIAATMRSDRPGVSTPGPAPVARVLVIEGDAANRARIVDALSRSGHQVDIAGDAGQAIRQARAHRYDGLTVDLTLAAPGGLDALSRIRGEDRRPFPTVLAVTLGDPLTGTAGFTVADVLAKPLQVSEVVLAMNSLGLTRRPGRRVVVIDDDPVALALMRSVLADVGIEALCFDGGTRALEAMRGTLPDALVLDLLMPGMDGFEVLERVRADAAWRDLPVFVWTSMHLTEAEHASLNRSASNILRKGGGQLDGMLDRLRDWRPALAPPASEIPLP